MTPAQCFDHNGRLQPFDGRPDEPYLYQWVHVLDGQPLRLDAHLHLLGTAYRALFGGDFRFDTAGIARRIEAMLRANRYPLSGSSFVRLRLYASGETALLPGGVSLYAGYALRSLRPSAVTVCCELPYDDRPTSLREAAAQLNRRIAAAAGAQVAVRCDAAGRLLDADDAPLFVVRGMTLLTPPAAESVERQIAREAIAAAGLNLREEPLTRETLRRCDELFCFDHRGVTALGSCDGTPYMDLIAGRIAQALAAPF